MKSDTILSREVSRYDRIAEAIRFLSTHFREQPSLDEMASQVHMSPFHFQRVFSEWAGTSPKKFLQYVSIAHARQVLRDQKQTLADAAFGTGLSGTGRLHDLFITLEGMTPAEYRDGGKNLQISYQAVTTRFGDVLVASTAKGICHLSFYSDQATAVRELHDRFPNAAVQLQETALQEEALTFFKQEDPSNRLKLHVKGTPFQLKVWEALLKIPAGGLSTYGDIAAGIGHPAASRAVGTAIGRNPVAYLIPCHRVIQSTGIFGGYMWGPERKTAIIGWEMARTSNQLYATDVVSSHRSKEEV